MALVAPASPFERAAFDAGVAELERLGFVATYRAGIFERDGFVAGPPGRRARELMWAFEEPNVDAILAVRGGYGSVEVLPHLDADRIARRRTAVVGYSDVTSLHAFLNTRVGLVTVHGPMLEGRLAAGPSAYDLASFLGSLDVEPLGELPVNGVEVIRAGEARGPLFGGTLTQILASFGTPYEFDPPAGHVLFLDEVGERPYRLHRMLTQYRLAGRFARAAAVVIGQLPRCDEPGGTPTGLSVVRELLADFPGPVLAGFPSGHATSPLVSLPFGVEALVSAGGAPKLVMLEGAAA